MLFSELSLPALAFKGTRLTVTKKSEDLERCTGTAWKRHYFDGLLVFDSSAEKYKVTKAERLGAFGGLFGFHADLSRWYRVRLTVEPASGGGIAEAKERVLRAVRSPSSAWEASGRLEEVVVGLEKASSIAEIVEALHLVP